MERIVLAYSGGLDTSVAIPWLSETYGAEVIAVTMDLGQGENLDFARERALATGATGAHVIDVREELAAGKSMRGALSAGYDKAFGTIFDSNLTTVISSVILTSGRRSSGIPARRATASSLRPLPRRGSSGMRRTAPSRWSCAGGRSR